MKTLISLLGGAVTVNEISGVISMNWDESLGGGAAAGILTGKGSLQLNGQMGLALGEKLLNAHLPASVQSLASVIEGIANQAIAAIE